MVKKVKNLFKKAIVFFLNIIGIGAFVSCDGLIEIIAGPEMYGMQENYYSVNGTVRGEDADGDGVGDPVPGIQYSYEEQLFEYIYDDDGNVIEEIIPVTGDDGNFYVSCAADIDSITVSFKDIDGEENGSYKDKEVTFTFSDKKEQEQDINLEPKE